MRLQMFETLRKIIFNDILYLVFFSISSSSSNAILDSERRRLIFLGEIFQSFPLPFSGFSEAPRIFDKDKHSSVRFEPD